VKLRGVYKVYLIPVESTFPVSLVKGTTISYACVGNADI